MNSLSHPGEDGKYLGGDSDRGNSEERIDERHFAKGELLSLKTAGMWQARDRESGWFEDADAIKRPGEHRA